MVRQANAGRPKGHRKPGQGLLLPAVAPHNWPDTGVCPARKGADADQVSHWSFKPKEPEPKDKLDAMGGSTAMKASSTARVDGRRTTRPTGLLLIDASTRTT